MKDEVLLFVGKRLLLKVIILSQSQVNHPIVSSLIPIVHTARSHRYTDALKTEGHRDSGKDEKGLPVRQCALVHYALAWKQSSVITKGIEW